MTGIRSTTSTLLATSLFLLAACGGEDPTDLSGSDVTGSYEATTLTVTQDGSTTDVLAEGGSMDITLEEDGTTSGTLVIPASLSESAEREQSSLAGTWVLTGTTVTFDHEADTFVRDMPFDVVSDRLEGEETFGDETVRAVLTRM